ncbi:hypothetical protein V493_08500 [Pseudogymnoascus sp. VKM F-4281 (FW-2241)]|nr:hypothetical protein V493_08500 [Pseudogymnoascus sp. VKM F-4281 (FW-2241)]
MANSTVARYSLAAVAAAISGINRASIDVDLVRRSPALRCGSSPNSPIDGLRVVEASKDSPYNRPFWPVALLLDDDAAVPQRGGVDGSNRRRGIHKTAHDSMPEYLSRENKAKEPVADVKACTCGSSRKVIIDIFNSVYFVLADTAAPIEAAAVWIDTFCIHSALRMTNADMASVMMPLLLVVSGSFRRRTSNSAPSRICLAKADKPAWCLA